MKVTTHAAARFEERGAVKVSEGQFRDLLSRSVGTNSAALSLRQRAAHLLGLLVEQQVEKGLVEKVLERQTKQHMLLVWVPSAELYAVCKGGNVVTCLTKEMVEESKLQGFYQPFGTHSFPLTTKIGEQQMGSADPQLTRDWARKFFTDNPNVPIKEAARRANNDRVPPLWDILREVRTEVRQARQPKVEVKPQLHKPAREPAQFLPMLPRAPDSIVHLVTEPVEDIEAVVVPTPPPEAPTTMSSPPPANAAQSPAKLAILEQARLLLEVMREHNVVSCTLEISDSGPKPKLDMSFDYRASESGSFEL